MSKPTPEQIAAEISALEACKEYVPTHTFFGEDNHALLDAQRETLENGWDEDEARGHFEEMYSDERITQGALSAIEWRDGYTNESPSSQWDTFKK